MLLGKVVDVVNDYCVVESVSKAANAWERARGLIARPVLKAEQGFWLEPCPSVHTLGMRYSLDIVFMDEAGWVKKIVFNLKPLRVASSLQSFSTLELFAGQAQVLGIKQGMRLKWKENSQ